MMCQRIGRLPTGTMGLGRTSVSSRSRVPRPPHRTKTGTSEKPFFTSLPLWDRAKLPEPLLRQTRRLSGIIDRTTHRAQIRVPRLPPGGPRCSKSRNVPPETDPAST